MRHNEGYHRPRRVWQPSDRQRQVLDLLVEGKSNAEIAVHLGITPDGVKWHVGELLGETGLEDRQALARWWVEERERAEHRGIVAFLLPWRTTALVTGIALTIAAVLLLPGTLGGSGEDTGLGTQAPRFADVAIESPTTVASDAADPSACPTGGSDLRGDVDRSELEAEGFIYVDQAFSRHDCPILVANRPGMSFVRVPLETQIMLGEGAASPIPAAFHSERREVNLAGRSLNIRFVAATRYNGTGIAPGGPGRELAIVADDEQWRPYSTAADSEGGLWIRPNPSP